MHCDRGGRSGAHRGCGRRQQRHRKVDGGALDNGNANEPHVGCDFAVEWFGFDSGAQSTVTFSMQSPSATPNTEGAPTSVQFGPFALDAAGNFSQSFDIYNLLKNFTPQQNQGFHVKLETNTTWSNGDDSKFKTYWVTGCERLVGSVTLDKVVSGPAPAGDPAYTCTVVAEDPGAVVSSPVTLEASDPVSAVATNVAMGSKVTITETGANGAALTSYAVDGGTAVAGASVEVTVSSTTAVAVVATNSFAEVLGTTTTRPDPTTATTATRTPPDDTGAPSSGALARTGTGRAPLVVLGFVLVGAGLAVSVIGRRLRTAR
jgi:hypothetical protein